MLVHKDDALIALVSEREDGASRDSGEDDPA